MLVLVKEEFFGRDKSAEKNAWTLQKRGKITSIVICNMMAAGAKWQCGLTYFYMEDWCGFDI